MGKTRKTVIEELSLAGPHGPLTVRSYTPATPPTGGVVWLHGGAFISGDLDMPESDWVAEQLAATGHLVVTVDYTLAPTPEWMAPYVDSVRDGARFPVASEEVAFVVRWASSRGAEWASLRWVLGGASAGGNLATGAALRLRDAGTDIVDGLVLAYPLVHRALPSMTSELAGKYETLPENERFSPETIDSLNLNYVGDERLLANPYAFPGSHDLTRMPATLIVNSDVDSLRASGQALAAELAASGVDVSVALEPGTRHGHLNEPSSAGATRTITRIVDWLSSRAAVARATP